MEALAAVVFERTPEGAVAIKSTDDTIPRRLRTLLLAMDGRSPVSQYVPFLTALAPLSDKFLELEKLGYVRRKGSMAPEAVSRFERAQPDSPGALLPRTGASARDPGFVPLHEADLNALAQSTARKFDASTGPAKASGASAFELELQAFARQVGQLPDPVPYAPPRVNPLVVKASAVVAGKVALPDIVREMEQFLSQSAGLDALPITLVLEQIKSLDQLYAELPSYLELIKTYGTAAEAHAERLAGLIDMARQ